MFLLNEFQNIMGKAIPIIVQVGVVYLILRFTFAISNVLIRLSSLNKPIKSPEVPISGADTIDDSEFPEIEEAKEPAALPEISGES